MEINRRISPLPLAVLIIALLPMALGATALILYPMLNHAAGTAGWRIILGTGFRMSCPCFGTLAVVLAVIGLRRGGSWRQAMLFWLALGIGLGETLPIWWLAVEILFAVIVVIIRLFHGLWL
jgi:hypothetical protein